MALWQENEGDGLEAVLTTSSAIEVLGQLAVLHWACMHLRLDSNAITAEIGRSWYRFHSPVLPYSTINLLLPSKLCQPYTLAPSWYTFLSALTGPCTVNLLSLSAFLHNGG